MKLKKEVKVGAVMLLIIGLLFWGANFLKGTNIFSSSRTYFAVYEMVDGLTKSNPVIINGLKVGKVEDIEFMPDNSGHLVVTFSLNENDVEIPEDTKAKIVSTGLLGSKSIDLQLGRSVTIAKEGDTLTSDIEASLTEAVNQQIAPLKNKAEALIKTVDSAITTVSIIFNKKARGNLDASFTSIRQSLEIFENSMRKFDGMVEDERNHIHKIFANVESITSNFSKNNEVLTQTMANLNTITDSLAGANLRQTVNDASIAMQEAAEAMRKINRGEGSLGQLISNDTLYNNLESAANNLDLLMIDMKEHPNRYVHFSIFGKKDK